MIGLSGFRAHNTNVFPDRPDRAYVGYLDYGAVILDISDKSQPKMISRWSNCPPNTGFNHTALPLFSRNLMLVSDESTKDNAADWPKLVWVLDIKVETNPLSISTLPLPSVDTFSKRGGRFGAHNLHENLPIPTSYRSDTIVLALSLTAGCARTISPIRISRRKSRISCRVLRQCRARAPSSSTIFLSTTAASSIPSIVSPVAYTRWK